MSDTQAVVPGSNANTLVLSQDVHKLLGMRVMTKGLTAVYDVAMSLLHVTALLIQRIKGAGSWLVRTRIGRFILAAVTSVVCLKIRTHRHVLKHGFTANISSAFSCFWGAIRFNTQMQVHVGRPTSIALPPAAQPAQPTNNNNATQGAGTVILGATQGEELRLLCSQELSGTILRFLAAQQQTAGNCPPFTGSVAFVNSPRSSMQTISEAGEDATSQAVPTQPAVTPDMTSHQPHRLLPPTPSSSNSPSLTLSVTTPHQQASAWTPALPCPTTSSSSRGQAASGSADRGGSLRQPAQTTLSQDHCSSGQAQGRVEEGLWGTATDAMRSAGWNLIPTSDDGEGRKRGGGGGREGARGQGGGDKEGEKGGGREEEGGEGGDRKLVALKRPRSNTSPAWFGSIHTNPLAAVSQAKQQRLQGHVQDPFLHSIQHNLTYSPREDDQQQITPPDFRSNTGPNSLATAANPNCTDFGPQPQACVPAASASIHITPVEVANSPVRAATFSQDHSSTKKLSRSQIPSKAIPASPSASHMGASPRSPLQPVGGATVSRIPASTVAAKPIARLSPREAATAHATKGSTPTKSATFKGYSSNILSQPKQSLSPNTAPASRSSSFVPGNAALRYAQRMAQQARGVGQTDKEPASLRPGSAPVSPAKAVLPVRSYGHTPKSGTDGTRSILAVPPNTSRLTAASHSMALKSFKAAPGVARQGTAEASALSTQGKASGSNPASPSWRSNSAGGSGSVAKTIRTGSSGGGKVTSSWADTTARSNPLFSVGSHQDLTSDDLVAAATIDPKFMEARQPAASPAASARPHASASPLTKPKAMAGAGTALAPRASLAAGISVVAGSGAATTRSTRSSTLWPVPRRS